MLPHAVFSLLSFNVTHDANGAVTSEFGSCSYVKAHLRDDVCIHLLETSFKNLAHMVV